MEAESEGKVARNEAIFRDANEAIERGLWPDQESSTVRFRCECGGINCSSAVEVDAREYERVRGFPQRFIMLNGHELPDVEVVVERRPEYVVVEKFGEAGAIAEAEDPRE
jgi:hypothetical protein